MNTEQGIQLQDLPGVVRRRGVAFGTVAGLAFLASVVIAAIIPNTYEAWTTLLVEPQTVSTKLVEAGLEGSELNKRLHLMTMQILSRERLSKVIDELGLYPDESREMTREEVIDLMRDDIRVEPVMPEMAEARRGNQELEINTFRLFYRNHSAALSAAVSDKLANDFIAEHIRERVEISSDTSEFIEAELERLSAAIAEVEQRIAAVKDENLGRLPEDLEANQRLLERAMTELRMVQRDLSLSESDEAFYRNQALTGAVSRYGSVRADTPLERKQQLQLALGEAQARGYTEKHPDILAIREELATLDQTLQADGADGQPVTAEQQLASNESKRAELRAQSARAEMQQLHAEIGEIESRIGATPRVAEQLVALERQHDHLYASFQDYSAKRLEAGVAANMERRQKGEQFKILETAFVPPEPASPNRAIILVLGVLFGLALGAGAALALELADTSVHEPRQLQVAFQLPVLAAIPRVVLESDRLRQRRRLLLGGAAAAVATTVALAGAGAGYWIVNGSPFGGGEASAAPPTTGAERPAPPRQG